MDNPPHGDYISRWKAPDRGKYKVNCDVAISAKEKEGIVAAVLRDWEGNIVDGKAKPVKVFSSLHGGALSHKRSVCDAQGFGCCLLHYCDFS
ncbi:hypothetical protein RHMOL_Rhmol04G0349500 [Rhododendron molle]|nr:hypothetical protein RHMOL_Rhmol04G0349500 [Rhododendron molle]